MRLVRSLLVVPFLATLPTLAAQSSPVLPPDQEGLSRFHLLIQGCIDLGEPFSSFRPAMSPAKWPLPVRLVHQDARVLFGSPYNPQTDAPLLSLDLDEFLLLPTAQDVRTWSADSSWAYTRCELLAHELAEGIEYARLVDSVPASDATPDTRFARLRYRAHLTGLEAERAVAVKQHTRIADGLPYGRTRHCFLTQDPPRPTLAIVLGQNSVLMELQGSNLHAIRYLPGVDACAPA